MHREYFYKDNRDYLFHQQVEIVEFEIKKYSANWILRCAKCIISSRIYYVGMILGDLFVIFVTEMILNVGIMKNIGKMLKSRSSYTK